MTFNKESFNSLIDNDRELFQSLLELFEQDWPMIIEHLKKACETSDSKTVEEYGHRIKGNLKNFYATELSEVALVIEESGRSGDIQNLQEKIQLLENGLKKLQQDLRDHFSSFQ